MCGRGLRVEKRVTTWMEDGHDSIVVLAFGSASLLEELGKHAHRMVPSRTTKGVMAWLRGPGIDAGFDVLRGAIQRGEIRVHPPIGVPVVIEARLPGVAQVEEEEKCS